MRSRDWWRVAPVVTMLAWGGNHFTVLLPLYRREEGYGQVAVDLLFAVYIVGIIPGFLVSGPLSDRFGRKPLLAAGVVLGIAGSAVLAADPAALPVLAAGRLLSGLSVAAAMVVGSSWIKELSSAPWPAVPGPVAARRASLTLTAGFGIGPGVSGVLAQWAPAPTLLPYVVHGVLTLIAAGAYLAAPESRPEGAPARRAPLVPRAARPRFLGVVAPAAPWVFGCAATAFAIVPASLAGVLGDGTVLYATLLAVVGLAAGATVQPFAARIGARTGGRQLPVGLGVAVVGLAAAALTGLLQSPALGVAAGVVLGCGYGLILVSGLTEVQRLAAAADLGGLSAVYYSLTYLGFTLPVIVAALTPVAPEPVLVLLLAMLCAASLLAVGRRLRPV